MSILTDIKDLITGAGFTLYTGYAPTGARLPYIVQRPAIVSANELAINGDGISWDNQVYLYTCGASFEASSNLALEAMRILQGARSGGSTMNTFMGYSASQLEGQYEAQVTVQLTKGEI